jgi:single-stranded-DNA-specific exonuclease
VGIVASKVTEYFHRPAAVLSVNGDHAKGSVRGYGGVPVLEGLRKCADALLGFGGHHHAAGVQLSAVKIEEFTLAFDGAIGGLKAAGADANQGAVPLLIDAEVELQDLTLPVLRQIEALAPFGPGNPEPVFLIHAGVAEKRILKGRHLKLALSSSKNGSNSMNFDAIWFNAAEHKERLDGLEKNTLTQWATIPEINRFRNSETPSLRICGWRENS